MIPQVCIGSERRLYCPHCGTKLYDLHDGTHGSCPHLVFFYVSSDPTYFAHVRPEYAAKLIAAAKDCPEYKRKAAVENPLTTTLEAHLASGSLDFEDGQRIASWFDGLPQARFPELLDTESVIYIDQGTYDAAYIVIDDGHAQHRDDHRQRRASMNIVWAEWNPGWPPECRHGIEFHDKKRKAMKEPSLIAFVEGFTWREDNPKTVTIQCITPDALTTAKTLQSFKGMIEDYVRQCELIGTGYLGRSRRLWTVVNS